MDANSILCVFIGLLVIVVRVPLIFAPEATIRYFDRVIATDAGIRTSALVVGGLAAAVLTMTVGGRTESFWRRVVGWLLALGALVLLIAPGSYRRLARGVIGFIQDSTDTVILRWIGFFGVAIGSGLVYAGIWVL